VYNLERLLHEKIDKENKPYVSEMYEEMQTDRGHKDNRL
jgi:hypothetical protein